MTKNINTNETDRLKEARESYSGRLLTNAQFDEAIAITSILEREIAKSGAFKEKLGDYAYAMARSERMDVAKAETVLRDLFKVRNGVTMNQMRQELMQREEALPGNADEQERIDEQARTHVLDLGDMIRNGKKITFHRAYAHQAEELAQDLGITDVKAKTLMRDVFKASENRELYDWGKELEDKYYRPQIEAEKREKQTQTLDDAQQAERRQTRRRSPSRIRL